MTFRDLEIFVAVCDCGTVTAAAEKLYISQPSVSTVIKELENQYNTKLFDRISNRLHLTSVGRELYSYAAHIITLMGEAEDKLKTHSVSSEVHAGASITIGTHFMPLIAARFTNLFPDNFLRVTINSSAEIESLILNNSIDFAVIEGTTESDYIVSETICRDVLVPVFPPEHAYNKKEKITPDEFFSLPFILRESGSGTRSQFDSTALQFGYCIKPIWESISTTAIINAVSMGIGVSVLPYKLVSRDIENGKVTCPKIENFEITRYFKLIYHKNKHLSQQISKAIALSRKIIQ